MTRKTHKNEDKLYNIGIIFRSYGYIGWIQFWGALFTFLVVANDFGFPPLTLFSMDQNINIIP